MESNIERVSFSEFRLLSASIMRLSLLNHLQLTPPEEARGTESSTAAFAVQVGLALLALICNLYEICNAFFTRIDTKTDIS